MPPAGLRRAAPLTAIALLVLGAPLALAGEDCLWYLDRNGSWHPGFNCEFFTFCCGTCYHRYCCRDLTLLITERQQKHCLAFRPGDSNDRHPSAASIPIPPGPQSWPCTPTAWLHVPTYWSCSPISTLPSWAPSLQPCSSSSLYATTALLPGSLRNQPCLCCPFSDANLGRCPHPVPASGPGGGRSPPATRPQTKPSPGPYWGQSPREMEQELN
ncbi:protein shisa-4 isoform X1 [Pongo pygmaeus]|uniref:protein shisa-4 isoform X1 n=1 Tax=Pongo abelii TaxID=9601 RepID=UPI0004F454C9|nr:protein shisa-4 isoform X1 [Pongo abelii]XP_054318311.1 protein shisa-4 isoform X1 [Pongo pygmaeus]